MSITNYRAARDLLLRLREDRDGALERFDVDLTGALVLDAGASTGGFTDCALQAGARRVIAVDVGRGQLHNRLLIDPRVDVHERTNVRHLEPGDLGPLVDVVVADPARAGLGRDGVAVVADTHAEQIALVSCDVASLVRDVELLAAAGYRATGIEVVDMFPNTHHVEAVTSLVRA